MCGRQSQKYDIVFYIDNSYHLSSDGFSLQREFFSSLAYYVYVGVNDSRIAAVTSEGYSIAGEILFNLTTFNNSGQVGTHLQVVQQSSRYTWHWKFFESGFSRAHDEVLMAQKRKNSRGVIIAVTTDSSLSYMPDTPWYITSARNNGTTVITVGVGEHVVANTSVTDPSLYFQASNASDLPAIASNIAQVLCGGKLTKYDVSVIYIMSPAHSRANYRDLIVPHLSVHSVVMLQCYLHFSIKANAGDMCCSKFYALRFILSENNSIWLKILKVDWCHTQSLVSNNI